MGLMDVGGKSPVETPNETAEKIMQYEKHYHEVVRDYQPEIKAIDDMLKNLRAEEAAFWKNFSEIERAMKNDDVLDKEIKAKWLCQYRTSMKESFEMSRKLIEHYIISNVEEFKRKLEYAMNRV